MKATNKNNDLPMGNIREKSELVLVKSKTNNCAYGGG